ncbi:MAG: GNAT family N-acetyltransferase, partial [Candidatus Nomurabacteria bacterium]
MKKKLSKKINIETERLILKSVFELDAKDLQKQANDKDVAEFFEAGFTFPYTLKQANKYVEDMKDSWNKSKEWIFAIYKRDSNDYIGNFGMKYDEQSNIITNVGSWIGKKYRKNGYLSEVFKKMCDFCFNELNARKIDAYCISIN